MRDYQNEEFALRTEYDRDDHRTEFDPSYVQYAQHPVSQDTILENRSNSRPEWNELPRCGHPQESLYTPEAQRLLPALLETDDGPITVKELLEAVLYIRSQKKAQAESEKAYSPRSESETVYMPQPGNETIYTPRPSDYDVWLSCRGRACLRLAEGRSSMLPQAIPVELPLGGRFTIGRFDVSVGRRQSDFEFDQRTKAVSRHHAVLERQMDGNWRISDCGSKAGTFVDGQKLQPNTPYRIRSGARISFGTAGADYVWEE